MVGTALLWAVLAALVYVPSSGGGARGTIVACLGFFSFATGLALFADGLKRDIVEQLRRVVKSNTSLMLWIVSGALVVLIAYIAEGSQLALVVFVVWLVARLFRDIGWFLRMKDRSKDQKHDHERE